jgi:DnaD/phage-associated family protein
MRKFIGFDIGEGPERRFTGVPADFFTQLLPQITNISELKVTLYVFYLAGLKRGEPKWVGFWELVEAEDLLAGLRKVGDPRPPEEQLREGLELALTRGTLIRLLAAPPPPEFFQGQASAGELEPASATWFLLNTAANREFIAKLERGEIQIENTTLFQGLDLWDWPLPNRPKPEGEEDSGEVTEQIRQWKQQRAGRWRLKTQRPDIYTLYEQNIGPLTPILSERLREADQLYPAEWIEAAFTEAVNYNRRSWAYISRILENWATDGKNAKNGQERREREREWDESRTNRRRTPLGGDGARTPVPSTRGEFLPGTPPQRPAPPDRERGRGDASQSSAGQLLQWRGAEAQRKRQRYERQRPINPEDTEDTEPEF